MRQANSSIGKTVKYLMLQELRMKKDKLLESMAIMVESIKNGRSFMLTKQQRLKLRV